MDVLIRDITLNVKDIEPVKYFYSNILGLREKSISSGYSYYSPQGGPELITLIHDENFIAKKSKTTGLYHIAFLYPDRKSLSSALHRLIHYKYQLTGFADHGVSEALYLSDPEGNGIELYTDRPKEEWDMKDGIVNMTADNLDIDSLLDESEYSEHSIEETGVKTGHIHLRVSDLSKAEKFYKEKLGFEVTQRNYPGALFLSKGGYHHHIGLNIWAGKSVSPPSENSTGLRHFRIDINKNDFDKIIENTNENTNEIDIEINDEKENYYIKLADPDRIKIIIGKINKEQYKDEDRRRDQAKQIQEQ
jgi:catechol 2,3-dioxygenase